MKKSVKNLDEMLTAVGGKQLSAFGRLKGAYDYGEFELVIEETSEGAPAGTVRCRVRIPAKYAGFSQALFTSRSREIALRDFLARSFSQRAGHHSLKAGGGGGRVAIDRLSQEILETSSVVVGAGVIEARFTVDIPMHQGRISGVRSIELFVKRLPNLVKQGLCFQGIESEHLTEWIESVEDADHLRGELKKLGLVAFIADGSILEGFGAEGRKRFRAPEELAVTVSLPNRGEVRGMGVPSGITVLAGGSGQGRKTILDAIALGVYNHIPGDGRELIITVPDAAIVRSEEGRRIEGVDLSMFMPGAGSGVDSSSYSVVEASLYESQAANVIEAIEAGSTTLLIDENASAAGFFTRDVRMQELVPDAEEPNASLMDVLPQLNDISGVSAIVSTGFCGDMLEIADTVIVVRDGKPHSGTDDAASIMKKHPTGRSVRQLKASRVRPRRPIGHSLEPQRQKQGRQRPRGIGYVQYGDEFIDMSCVTQLVSSSQARGIARGIALAHRLMDGSCSLADAVKEVMKRVDTVGLDTLSNRRMGDLSGFRAQELAAAINRIRNLKVK